MTDDARRRLGGWRSSRLVCVVPGVEEGARGRRAASLVLDALLRRVAHGAPLLVVEVRPDDLAGGPVLAHPAVLEPQGRVAQRLDLVQAVRDEDDRLVGLAQRVHAPHALLLERRVADGEHLVDEQHVGVELADDREAQAGLHARAVVLHRRVDEVLEAGELDDVGQHAIDLRLAAGRAPTR